MTSIVQKVENSNKMVGENGTPILVEFSTNNFESAIKYYTLSVTTCHHISIN